ncbi:MAG: response regulator [Eubacteriales bacterium]|nr:response regulator [Eubacteriales bacterium]
MPKNALIIDDNILLTEALQENIDWNSLGILVTHTLHDALQVQEILSKEPVDIIISDIRMPGLSGLDMARQVLSEYPHIKIILISAYEDFQYVQEAIRLGAFDYIEKPVDEAYLYRIAEKACQQIDLDKKIQKQLNASKPAMKEKFFHDILRHNAGEALYHYKDYPGFLDISTDNKYHLCICIKISNSGKLKAQFGLEKYYLDLLSLENSIQEAFSGFPLCYLMHNGNSLILILGRSFSDTEIFMNFVDQKLRKLLSQPERFSLTIGVGAPVTSFWNLRQSYESARLALDYRFFLPEENMFCYQDMPKETFTPDINLESKSSTLINFVCKNQKDELRNFINELYDEYLKLHINKNSLFFSIFDIVGKLLGFLYKMGVEPSSLDPELLKNCGDPRYFSTSRELFDWLYSLCEMACDKLDSSVSHYQNRLVTMVDQYIQEHYSESELGLNQLAAHVNVSPNHLSATYKKITGRNIIDAIGNTRITNAEKLLLNSTLTMKEISEKTGFSNQYYFSACFKKVTGKSPSAFRSEATA